MSKVAQLLNSQESTQVYLIDSTATNFSPKTLKFFMAQTFSVACKILIALWGDYPVLLALRKCQH